MFSCNLCPIDRDETEPCEFAALSSITSHFDASLDTYIICECVDSRMVLSYCLFYEHISVNFLSFRGNTHIWVLVIKLWSLHLQLSHKFLSLSWTLKVLLWGIFLKIKSRMSFTWCLYVRKENHNNFIHFHLSLNFSYALWALAWVSHRGGLLLYFFYLTIFVVSFSSAVYKLEHVWWLKHFAKFSLSILRSWFAFFISKWILSELTRESFENY